METVAKIYTAFPEKFGIPRQSGMTEDEAFVVLEKKYRVDEALRGIEEYSHLWLIWQFSENVNGKWSPTVRPPRLGGNKRVGVFATRSSFRPNFLGLSSVRLKRVENSKNWGKYLVVQGADIMNGTPIFDIKPYLGYTDCHPDAKGSFAQELSDYRVPVSFSTEIEAAYPEDKIKAVKNILEKDPRPSYHDDDRMYSFEYSNMNIKFKFVNGGITVTEIKTLKEE